MRKVKIGITVSLLMMLVGFATITTTLVVNGTISFISNKASFESDIIFSKAEADEGTSIISPDEKSITFNTGTLTSIEQTSILDFEVTNKSRQYNATGNIVCEKTDKSNLYNDYVTITVEPKEFLLNATEVQQGRVTVMLNQSYAGEDEVQVEFKCILQISAQERDTLAE